MRLPQISPHWPLREQSHGPSAIHIPLKGGYDHIRTADIYAAAEAWFRERWPDDDGRCRLMLHRTTSRSLSLALADAQAARPDDLIAEFNFKDGTDAMSLWFLERDGEQAPRGSFDESSLAEHCLFSQRQASVRSGSDADPIELIATMTGHLLRRLAPPPSGQWVFSRLDTMRLLRREDSEHLTVTVMLPLRPRLTQSIILVKQEPVGSLFFSLVH